MSDVTLNCTVQSVTPKRLDIKVKITSAAPLDKVLVIELFPPADLLDTRIIAASKKAPSSRSPYGAFSVAGIVTADPSLSVWVKADLGEAGLPIMLRNDKDQVSGKTKPATTLAKDLEFTIGIPLDEQAQVGSVEFGYASTYNEQDCGNGRLKVESDPSGWAPEVTFKTSKDNPTAVDYRERVVISWIIKDGVSATLRGPLPNGATKVVLSDDERSLYKLSKGEFEIYAVGPVSYLLQAEVKGPPGKPNVEVVKVVSLDVKSIKKYGYIKVIPDRILPYGPMRIDWAAWGVDRIYIDLGSTSFDYFLTDMTRSGSYQGIGFVNSDAGASDIDRDGDNKEVTEKTVNLRAEIGKAFESESWPYKIITWRRMKTKSTFTGQPVGLAVAGAQMALLTTNGLWLANVGVDDKPNYGNVTEVKFTRPATVDTSVTWRAIAAFEGGFIVLRQTTQNVLQAALYNSAGTLEGTPIDLPNDLKPVIEATPVFEVTVYNGRAYVVVQPPPGSSQPRRAFSVSFTGTQKVRDELLLEHLPGYRLVTFDDALYALSGESGRVFRFTVNTQGNLVPHRAADAVDKGASMIKQGMFVPVGRILAVLGPSSVPSVPLQAKFALKNVLSFKTSGLLRSGSTPQDLFYNPQHNSWGACGHGIELKPGMVWGFRGGSSPRLWMVEPGGEAYTLTVGSEHLFSNNYISNFQTEDLDPFFNQTRKFTIVNPTDMQFVPLNATCERAGLTAFSSTSPVEMTPRPINLGPKGKADFELRYNKEDSMTTTLRFLMQRPAGITNEYFLELTISGPDLTTATTVFKRIAANGSIAEVPGTRKQHSTAGPIEFDAKPLVNGISLGVGNASPFNLWLRSGDGSESAYNGTVIRITYSTPSLSMYAHGPGELAFDVDFALPGGMEVTQGSVRQTKRLRVNNKSTGLRIESPNIQETGTAESISFTLRYGIEIFLGGVYIGDGMAGKTGDHLYIPIGLGPNFADVLKIDANTLASNKRYNVEMNGVFSVPNALAVSPERVVETFRNHNWIVDFDYDLNRKTGGPLYVYDVITNVKAFRNENKLSVVGMKQTSSNPAKYSYRYTKHTFTAYEPEQEMMLDALKGFRPARVPGAPSWVSPETISPMDAHGDTVALCVEGGIIFINMRTKAVTEIPLDGTGREEAVAVDPTSSLVFCAHNATNNQGLVISRIDSGSPINRMSIQFSNTVAYMVENTNPPVGPHLRYNRQRAVSMIATQDRLFVSHGTRIYILEKWNLNSRGFTTLDLPCRLVHVRLGKPPGENHPKYGAPKDCYFVWAIGARYVGDGRTRDSFQTKLYKIALLP